MAGYQSSASLRNYEHGNCTGDLEVVHLGGQFAHETSKRLFASQINFELDQPQHVEHRKFRPGPLSIPCRDPHTHYLKDKVSGNASDSGVSMASDSNSLIFRRASTNDQDNIAPLPSPAAVNELSQGLAQLQQQYRIPYGEDDSWSDEDSAISGIYNISRCPPPPPTPLEGHHHQQMTETAFTRAFERKMDLERHKAAGQYTHTEQRQRGFNWKDEFYIDKDGHTGVWQEVTDEQHRHLAATDPAYSLSSCRWHKSKLGPARQVPAEEGGLPVLKVTDPEEQEWFLDDLFFYSDEGDESEEEDDEAIYE
jgi:hypothetical protein